ncbi:Cof-type HAD-IIB family hydrolase [Candidatus Enterococcus clewellii]|uniref:HAD superfamily hydrolase n=1 Tax=Candidatus Enterococcus clewellii TaxID=1834193 RepID=A0A242K984_9ENTE|nr:Cof-type HAD-IIB family hydrolase [Enterococcus sp. 9E7_DIV0242]OTP17712.1 hypothetical protein A5888_001850 [Enterococcus sp. 9E7_DIV0242]
MKNQEIKLIISDIDGTILDDCHSLDTELKDNIQQLKAKEIPFILASARSPKGIFPIAESLDLADNPIACYNGALIVKGSSRYQTLIEHQLAHDEVSMIVDIIVNQFPEVSINLYSGADWYVNTLDKWTAIEAAITKETPEAANLQLLLLKKHVPVHKLLLVEEADVIKKVHDYMQNLHLFNSSFYLSKDNYLEVTSKQVSKEKALVEVADYYNVPLAQTMSIGDNFNDIPMLKLAGLGVAMSNAPQEVKWCADVETKTNNDNGVSAAIQKYVFA